ncbi:unnamed protein product [Caenorhabditis angaria]|uniref:Helicase ATP-binding domain-containing protein n=1 Tax=Caenorhabditis angaria TaxID=860376 RepID=A0A9P1ITZ8_9PELO|nr:unnamed protein product [Caenorhabditis angaria]
MNREKMKIDKHRTFNLHPLSSKKPIDISLARLEFQWELKNVKESSVLYLQYDMKDETICILIDLEPEERAGYANSCGKNSVLVEKIPIDQICGFSSKLLKLFAECPGQFKLAGIKILWSLSENNGFQIEIQVENESLLNSFEHEKIFELSQYKVATILNTFFNSLRLWNSDSFAFWPNNPKYNSKEGSDFFAFFNALQKTTEDWKPEAGNENEKQYEVRDDLLNSQLMDYQKTTVKWMISREIDGKNTEFFGLFQSLPIESIFYYPAFGVFSKKPDLSVESIPNGGILADEMGLGKTLEMLALIVSNPKEVRANLKKEEEIEEKLDWKQYKQQKAKKIDVFPVVYTAEHNPTKSQKLDILQKCSKCQENCVLKKCGWKKEFDDENIDFLCPLCMAKEDPLNVGTTLIIVPETLSMQWYQEIVKHCNKNLKVMFYFGLKKSGYLNPHDIANYDVIFVTYQTLVGELVFTNFKNDEDFGSRKFSPSSMTHVKWWRLITDESQLVEVGGSKRAEMCQIIKAKYRWAMTATPILKDIHGLGGLF